MVTWIEVDRSGRMSKMSHPNINKSKINLVPVSKKSSKHCTNLGQKYLNETSIHGLKYIVEEERHLSERIFWFLASLFGLLVAVYLIYSVLVKWYSSPLLVSLASASSPISDIPFPPITICNMNKIYKSKIGPIIDELKIDSNNKTLMEKLTFAEEVCGTFDRNMSSLISFDLPMTTTFNPTEDTLFKYWKELGPTCDDMLLDCSFETSSVNCSDIFTHTLTDSGMCCSFNLIPSSILLRNPVVPPSPSEALKWSFWDIQNGYSRPFSTSDVPKRTRSSGKHLGLTVTLDIKEEEYFCSESQSSGVLVRLHTPTSIPEMREYGLGVHPGTEVYARVSPTVIHSLPNIQATNVKKRHCYFQGEHNLAFYHNYTYNNCMRECGSNLTFAACNCVGFHMPRSKDMPICPPNKSQCARNEQLKLKKNISLIESGPCACLPSCSDIKYNVAMTMTMINDLSLLKLNEDYLSRYGHDSHVQNNLSVIHLFYEENSFIRYERRELYGITDFFSNIGGVLGLCMGLSSISVIEIIYFFTLRFFFNGKLKRTEKI